MQSTVIWKKGDIIRTGEYIRSSWRDTMSLTGMIAYHAISSLELALQSGKRP